MYSYSVKISEEKLEDLFMFKMQTSEKHFHLSLYLINNVCIAFIWFILYYYFFTDIIFQGWHCFCEVFPL